MYWRRRVVALLAVATLLASIGYGVDALFGGTRSGGGPRDGEADGPGVEGVAGLVAAGEAERNGEGGPSSAGAETEERADTPPPPPPGIRAFAEVGTLRLYQPGRDIRSIGYHQAGSPLALAISPLGRLVGNDNRRHFKRPSATAGPDYVVLEDRRRGTAPTSAVDVAMPRGEPVLAPVDGRVRSVSPYRLYGVWPDMRVEIRASGSRLVVVIVHLTDVAVKKGDRVRAGVTSIGVPRVLDVRSDIARYVGKRVPHVHIEVKGHRPRDKRSSKDRAARVEKARKGDGARP